jgi:hypothetical protein
MSRFLDPVEFADALASNGLSCTWVDCPRGDLLVHRQTGGPSVPVVMGPQGLVDWSGTCQDVLRVCFGYVVQGGASARRARALNAPDPSQSALEVRSAAFSNSAPDPARPTASLANALSGFPHA